MSTFLVNLWESIFTPGPTPTLLIATNATFGALQLLLLALLVATSSVHFAILSVLCAGLWYSINWFAREVQAAKAAEAGEAPSKANENNTHNNTRQTSPDPTGSDTETEADPIIATGANPNPTQTTPSSGAQQRRKPPPPQPGQAPMPPPTSRPPVPSSSAGPSSSGAAQVTSKPASAAGASSHASTRTTTAQHLSPNPPTSSPAGGLDGSQDLSASATGRRRPSMGDSSGYVSTDSEWEKVSDQEGK